MCLSWLLSYSEMEEQPEIVAGDFVFVCIQETDVFCALINSSNQPKHAKLSFELSNRRDFKDGIGLLNNSLLW